MNCLQHVDNIMNTSLCFAIHYGSAVALDTKIGSEANKGHGEII